MSEKLAQLVQNTDKNSDDLNLALYEIKEKCGKDRDRSGSIL